MTGTTEQGRAHRLEPSEAMVDDYAAITHLAMDRVLGALGDVDYAISLMRTRELAFYFLRDLLRIGDRQDQAISGTKFAGYWGFWIRKVKPSQYAFDKSNPSFGTGARDETEIPQINERVALEVAISFLAAQGKGGADFLHDQVRVACDRLCDGTDCLENYARRFLEHSNNAMQEYVIYSMAFRTFGPHHMTMFLDQLVYGSCQAFAGPISATPLSESV